MRYLAFERRYALEGDTCPRCGGAGVPRHSSRRLSRDCLNCRGLGRRLTRRARGLFNELCEMLGQPVTIRESRIRPDQLDMILGGQVRAGMSVAPLGNPRPPAKTVRRVEAVAYGLRLHFTDRTVLSVSPTTSLYRTLTRPELARVDAVMAARLGDGATPRRREIARTTG